MLAIFLALAVSLIGVAVFYVLMRFAKGPELAGLAAKRFAMIWIPLHLVGAIIAVAGQQ